MITDLQFVCLYTDIKKNNLYPLHFCIGYLKLCVTVIYFQRGLDPFPLAHTVKLVTRQMTHHKKASTFSVVCY